MYTCSNSLPEFLFNNLMHISAKSQLAKGLCGTKIKIHQYL